MNIPASYLVLLLCGSADAAGIKQWTDADGQTHYGDIAPAGSRPIEPDLQPAFRSDTPGLRPSEKRALKQIRKNRKERARDRDHARKAYQKKRRDKTAFCEKTAQRLRKLASEGDPDSRWTRSDLHRQRREANCF